MVPRSQWGDSRRAGIDPDALSTPRTLPGVSPGPQEPELPQSPFLPRLVPEGGSPDQAGKQGCQGDKGEGLTTQRPRPVGGPGLVCSAESSAVTGGPRGPLSTTRPVTAGVGAALPCAGSQQDATTPGGLGCAPLCSGVGSQRISPLPTHTPSPSSFRFCFRLLLCQIFNGCPRAPACAGCCGAKKDAAASEQRRCRRDPPRRLRIAPPKKGWRTWSVPAAQPPPQPGHRRTAETGPQDLGDSQAAPLPPPALQLGQTPTAPPALPAAPKSKGGL